MRAEALSRLNKYIISNFEFPIEDVDLPESELANRDLDYAHACFLAEEMEMAGPTYPHKPGIICAFKVHSERLRICLS